MNDSPAEDRLFNACAALWAGDICAYVSPTCRLLVVRENKERDFVQLKLNEAKALRDWLNKVIP